MKIMSFDLGKTSAWYCDGNSEEFAIESLKHLHAFVKSLLYGYTPDIVIYPQPTRYYNVYRKHWQYIGIINLVCEKMGITTIEVIDSTAKKVVLGNGRAKKAEIMEYFKEESEHIADARMFEEWYVRSVK